MRVLFAVVALLGIAASGASRECGMQAWRTFDQTNYITGGKNFNYPDSVVSVQAFMNVNDGPYSWMHVCGGTILNGQWVLTAGHCIDSLRPWDHIRIVADRWEINSTEFGQEIPIKLMYEHPLYAKTFDGDWYDVGLLHLERNISLSTTVSPACLNRNLEDTETLGGCVSLGYGKNVTDGFTMNLQLVRMDRASFRECVRVYRYNSGMYLSERHQVCAGRFGTMGGICDGDQGGPLLCRTTNGRIELAGVAARTTDCETISQLGVYTRIDEVLPWIVEVTGDRSLLE